MLSYCRIFSIRFTFAFVLLAGFINSFAQPAITGIYVPRFVQGAGNADPASERRVPYGHYVEVTGLIANATYRYCNRFTDLPTSGNNGFGNWIIANKTGNFSRGTSVALGTPGNYGEFTTDNTGRARLWLIGEPSIDSRFNPPSLVPLYARLLLNNGAGGASVATRLTLADAPITTINFGSANDNVSGTGVRSTAAPAYSAKDFIMLYDNIDGTGRPIAGTYVESDGVQQRVFNDPDPSNEGYAPFYAQEVDGKDKTWGVIIPNALPNGIRNISSYSLQDGSLVFETKSADATYPTIPSGTISTVNPTSGLNALVISGASALPVKLSSFAAVCGAGEEGLQLEWKAELESDLASYEIQQAVDGVNFSKLASHQPKGARVTYRFMVPDNSASTYFRLKMIDKDGKYEFSKVVRRNCAGMGKFSVYPNPATHSLRVDHKAARQGASVSIMSMNGSQVQRMNMLSGSTYTMLNIGSLTPGNYLLVIRNGEEVEAQGQFTKL